MFKLTNYLLDDCHFSQFLSKQLYIVVMQQCIIKMLYWSLESISVDLRNKFIYWSFFFFALLCRNQQKKVEPMPCFVYIADMMKRIRWKKETKWNCCFKCKMNITTLTHGSFHIMIYRNTLIHLNVEKSMFLLPLFISICLFLLQFQVSHCHPSRRSRFFVRRSL